MPKEKIKNKILIYFLIRFCLIFLFGRCNIADTMIGKPEQKLNTFDLFCQKYNRGPCDEEITRLLILRFPEIKIPDLVDVVITASEGGVIQTMDRWVKNTKTQKIYFYNFEQMYWYSPEESQTLIVKKYGSDRKLVEFYTAYPMALRNINKTT